MLWGEPIPQDSPPSGEDRRLEGRCDRIVTVAGSETIELSAEPPQARRVDADRVSVPTPPAAALVTLTSKSVPEAAVGPHDWAATSASTR
jgi:hypothetical protein